MVIFHLDYCSALLTGLPKKSMNRLWLVQNAVARVLTKRSRGEHITHFSFFALASGLLSSCLFLDLYWFKKVLVYTSLNGTYIGDCLSLCAPEPCLRWWSSTVLNVPTVQYEEAGFCYCWATACLYKCGDCVKFNGCVLPFNRNLKCFYTIWCRAHGATFNVWEALYKYSLFCFSC